ncbi:CAP domain-containing protein [Streptomyces liangshanensis]|uniref:CAP domain-containing protein n=1 Tax=Streptomyces liangshanensis TaxID=2717324 RepID=A0A6G9GW20_9ACTN|nr:CAP domain-containing protein [Streptomyces liangshanensis]QIQ02458.1 CAP domain-containing protein [Streptomyces liangshanensis]
MGRHSRSAAVPAAVDYADATAGRHRGGARRKRRVAAPVRTGLLGASAAMAVGAVAVASGLLPGGDQYNVGGGPTGEQVRTEGAPDLLVQGSPSAEPTELPSASASPSAPGRVPTTPAKKPAASPSKPAAEVSRKAKAPVTRAPETKKAEAPATKAPEPEQTTQRAAESQGQGPAAASAATAVLSLVNQERAKVGCAPVKADSSLAGLAQDFSQDMAARGFFDHTDPDGKTPWDRADQAGVKKLGGENIARGQADAQAVMDSWMNSEGHRANILNCDYTRLGVGVVTGTGGPWWTQDFGF